MYQHLDTGHVIATVEELRQRIAKHFPGSGLSKVCAELKDIADRTVERSQEIERPQYALRAAAFVLIAALVVAPVGTVLLLHPEDEQVEALEFVQVLEAGMNVVVLIGAAVISLITVETRVKRRRALDALHELRSLAHIVDMHQLPKDPALLSAEGVVVGRQTVLSPAELARYLDFCSDMLSLVGKIAAIYVEHFQDAVVLAAANEVEALVSGLSSKVWQKLTLVQQQMQSEEQPT